MSRFAALQNSGGGITRPILRDKGANQLRGALNRATPKNETRDGQA